MTTSTTTLTLSLDNLDHPTALYEQYAGQHAPQPAYVQLTEDGTVSAYASGEIGGGAPAHVWHNRTLRWSINPSVDAVALADWIHADEDVLELLERVHAGHDVAWDGSNMRGSLDADATAASEQLERVITEFGETYTIAVWQSAEYIQSASLTDLWPVGQTLADAATAIVQTAQSNGDYIQDSMSDALLDRAEGLFDEDGNDALQDHHVAALVESGRINQEQADSRAEAHNPLRARFSSTDAHFADCAAGQQALREYIDARAAGVDDIEATIRASNVLQRAGYNVNANGGVSIDTDEA